MKKILFSLALLTGLGANAQLPNGSVAPDFTLTDIDGNTHNLYTYLNAGKTVFIDVSATWCGPCWNFHNTHALDNLWTNHGPVGGNGVSAGTTDDVIVIYIEGDGTTTNADLHGTGGNTQGNWVTGVEHPIIDPPAATINSFNDDYAIGYFPTIYKICPNRIIEEIGQQTAAVLYASVADCPAPASNPADVSALAYKGNASICGPATYVPSVQIQNYGLDPLTDATVEITLDGNVVSTGTYSGSLATYDVAVVSCTPIADFSGGDLVVTVTTNNDADATNGDLNFSVLGAAETSSRILLTMTTDGYASEVSWNIKNSTNSVVPGTIDPTLANNTTYNMEYNLGLGCYTFNITDSYGDGLLAPGVVNVRDENNVVLLNNEDYGTGTSIPFKVISVSTVAPSVTSTATITNNTITVCQGTSVTLTSSSNNGNSWSSGQTTKSITVTAAGTYSVTVNGVTSTAITVVVNTPDPVTYVEPNNSVCVYNAAFELTAATPAGGTYSGTGVSGGMFNPAAAGVGSRVVTYTYTNGSGCTSTGTQTIVVNACASVEENEADGGVVISPNPSAGKFVIEGANLVNYKQAEVVDFTGRTIRTVKIDKAEVSMNLEGVSNGTYIVKLSGDAGIASYKIQVNK
ncbi:MAG: T9SS type A sorting domain-containing protein [Bacteroidota bacterium]